MATKKKRNPQDATLKNINALKKRVSTLEKDLGILRHAAVFIFEALEARRKKQI